MPAGGFKTFTAGAVLTASDVNAYLMQGVLVFANETARNAITAQKGQVCIVNTNSSITATGAATYVPGAVLYVYNGSTWVCMSDVGAYTGNQGTTTSTTFTASLSGTPGTNPSVTIPTGTSALVTVSGTILESIASNGYIGFAVSGASTVAASTSFAALSTSATNMGVTFSVIVAGLTAGNNTFTLQYSINPTQTMTVAERRISVRGLL
jgi:ribosomal protein L35AE/L33A